MTSCLDYGPVCEPKLQLPNTNLQNMQPNRFEIKLLELQGQPFLLHLKLEVVDWTRLLLVYCSVKNVASSLLLGIVL